MMALAEACERVICSVCDCVSALKWENVVSYKL